MKQQQDDEEDQTPPPTLQRQTTTTAGKFDVLKHSISSLKIDHKRKCAIMEIVEKLEVDSHTMEQALEESTLDAALAEATAKQLEMFENADEAEAAADAAALVRTMTGSSTKSDGSVRAAAPLARQRWHVATVAATATTGLRRTKTVA